MLSTVIPQLGKVFRIEVVLAVPMDQLYHELFESLERMPEWNPTLSQVKVIGEMDPSLYSLGSSHSPVQKANSKPPICVYLLIFIIMFLESLPQFEVNQTGT